MSQVTCPSCLHTTPVLAGSPGSTVTCLRCRAPIPPELLASRQQGVQTEVTAPQPPGHAVVQFVARPGGHPAGVVVAFIAGICGAIVLAFAAAVLRQVFWLVLIFPALYGMALGWVAGTGGWLAKMREHGGVLLAGLVAGIVGAVLLHYYAYSLAAREVPQLGTISFVAYLNLLCRTGVQIESLDLGYFGSIIYYSVECIVIVVAASAVAASRTTGPFCEDCNKWKEDETFGPFKIDVFVATEAVAAGRPSEMVAPTTSDDKVKLKIYRCPRCDGRGTIEVELEGTRIEGNTFRCTRLFLTYPGAAAAEFEKIRKDCWKKGLLIQE